jgi:hypothetical protein
MQQTSFLPKDRCCNVLAAVTSLGLSQILRKWSRDGAKASKGANPKRADPFPAKDLISKENIETLSIMEDEEKVAETS